MSLAPQQARAWVEINLSYLEQNLRAIRQSLPPWLNYIAVVKANAYGHGIAPVVTRLMRAQADAFAVANLDEASQVENVGSGWPVLILSALLPSEFRDAVEQGFCPVISSRYEADELAKIGHARKQPTPVHLKIDTGMGRLGVWHEHAEELLTHCMGCPDLSLQGICTHFASAESDPELTAIQRQRFVRILHLLPTGTVPHLLIHADNSAGIDSFPAGGPFNAARVGLLQFGISPGKHALLAGTPTCPVLSFHCRVALIKSLPPGTGLSYGQTYRLTRPSKIAVLSAGYADGISTALSNRGSVLINGYKCPIVGRVTMDQTLVDVTDLPTEPARGTRATLIGDNHGNAITAEEFSRNSGVSPWEALCAISSRTQRHYLIDTAV